MSNEVADLIEQAADILETVGHAKGRVLQRDPSNNIIGYCVTGALAAVTQHKGLSQSYHFAVKELVTRIWPDKAGVVTRMFMQQQICLLQAWNDDQATAEQVIDLLKHTAKDLRNQGEAA